MDLKEKESKIYNYLSKLQNGNYEDKKCAFECIGYLSNQFIEDSLELRLNIISDKLKKYLTEKDK